MTTRPPHCGTCDERTRLVEDDAGTPRRCPACHPLLVAAPEAPDDDRPVGDAAWLEHARRVLRDLAATGRPFCWRWCPPRSRRTALRGRDDAAPDAAHAAAARGLRRGLGGHRPDQPGRARLAERVAPAVRLAGLADARGAHVVHALPIAASMTREIRAVGTGRRPDPGATYIGTCHDVAGAGLVLHLYLGPER